MIGLSSGKKGRVKNIILMDWKVFEVAFLNKFFPREMREAKVGKFMNLKKGSVLVKEYSLKFTQLSKCASEMMVDPKACISKFITGMSELARNKYTITIIIGDMDISQLLTYDQQIESKKLNEQERKPKRLG